MQPALQTDNSKSNRHRKFFPLLHASAIQFQSSNLHHFPVICLIFSPPLSEGWKGTACEHTGQLISVLLPLVINIVPFSTRLSSCSSSLSFPSLLFLCFTRSHYLLPCRKKYKHRLNVLRWNCPSWKPVKSQQCTASHSASVTLCCVVIVRMLGTIMCFMSK